jgi:large subunit ribosomal protein L28
MARMCEVCGKGVQKGNQIETRGKAKYLGGVGTKITGKTRRDFRPNLQTVCTRCLRSGAVTKAVKQKPFQLPTKT